MNFSGQVVALTGAGSGIGQAIATQLAGLGAQVYATDVSEAALAPLSALDMQCDVVDLTDRARAAAWVGSIAARAGKIDVLINNAGGVAGQGPKPIEAISDEEWDKLFDVNLNSLFAVTRAVAPVMKAAGSGAIVTLSSSAAIQASLTGIQAYCASKHGVLGLTRQLAHEFGPSGIRVNSVAPGFIPTLANVAQWEAMGSAKQAALLEGIALRRFGKPEDIANVVVWLASSMSSFVNGQVISVDGGK